MKLSTRSRYGTRILIDLASYLGKGPVQISEISNRQKIPAKYLEQLIRPLKKADLVTSVRGAKGGHMLAKMPGEITLGEIVRIFEAQSDLVECIGYPEKCPVSEDCKVRLAWQDATRAMYKSLDATTIADLVGANSDAMGDMGPCLPAGSRGSNDAEN